MLHMFDLMNLDENMSNPIEVDITGLIGVCLEAEMTWHELEMSAIKNEALAIINENKFTAGVSSAASKVAGGASKFFNAAVEFFKTLWQKFTMAITSIRRKVLSLTAKNEMYFRTAKTSPSDANKTVEIYNWKNVHYDTIYNGIIARMNAIITRANTPDPATSQDMIKVINTAGLDGINALFKTDTNKSNVKVSEVASQYIGLGRNFKAFLKSLNTATKALNKCVSEGKKSAVSGMKKVKSDEAEVAKYKTIVSNYKNASLAVSMVINTITKNCFALYSDCVKVRRALGSDKNLSRDDKKNLRSQSDTNYKSAMERRSKTASDALKSNKVKSESYGGMFFDDILDESYDEDDDLPMPDFYYEY